MDSQFHEKAKRLLAKQGERLEIFDGGGNFFPWTDEDLEVWRRIQALAPADRLALGQEEFNREKNHRSPVSRFLADTIIPSDDSSDDSEVP